MSVWETVVRSMRAAGLGLCGLMLVGCVSVPYATLPSGPAERPYQPPVAWNGSGGPSMERPATPLQCVPFARNASRIEIYGDAHTWWDQAAGRYPRSSIPAEGSVLVLRGYNTDARGHVAVVTQIVSDREILVDQANWMNGGEITRRVPVLDVSPGNDWSQVRVWWLPTQSLGVRIYQAQGFIHPLPVLLAAS